MRFRNNHNGNANDGVLLEGRGGHRRGRQRMAIMLALFVAAVAGAALTLVLQRPRPTQPTSTLNAQSVYNRVSPSIVDVTASLTYTGETAEGTGFVISAPHGLVLTNNHVINGATSVSVTIIATGRTYHATVVGDDTSNDVALLRLADDGHAMLTTAPLGNSSGTALGEPVLGIGNSGGAGGAPTIAPGYITGLNRTIQAVDQSSGVTETLRGVLQVTAQIQPGDSGGPLVNASGQVIGVDTAASQPPPGSGSAQAAGFAVPIGAALADVGQIEAGHAGRGVDLGLSGFLGVVVAGANSHAPQQTTEGSGTGSQGTGSLPASTPPAGTGTAQLSPLVSRSPRGIAPPGKPCISTIEEAGVPLGGGAAGRSGALVAGVLCGTPAAGAAGLGPGAVITGVGRRAVSSAASLTAILDASRPGQTVWVRWVTPAGHRRMASVTLGTAPAR